MNQNYWLVVAIVLGGIAIVMALRGCMRWPKKKVARFISQIPPGGKPWSAQYAQSPHPDMGRDPDLLQIGFHGFGKDPSVNTQALIALEDEEVGMKRIRYLSYGQWDDVHEHNQVADKDRGPRGEWKREYLYLDFYLNRVIPEKYCPQYGLPDVLLLRFMVWRCGVVAMTRMVELYPTEWPVKLSSDNRESFIKYLQWDLDLIDRYVKQERGGEKVWTNRPKINE